jgi:predicted nucleic acid-binding Zn ribbon protein
LSLGRLSKAWASVVGDALASETRPVALDEAGLVIAATNSGWAAQVRFLSEEVRKRASEALGGEAISDVRVVVREPPQNRR